MRLPLAVVVAALLTSALPIVAAEATSCQMPDEETRTCGPFSCAWESNTAAVSASYTHFYTQGGTISIQMKCGSAVAAACAGKGDCRFDTGAGPQGGGSCVLTAHAGWDARGACAANEAPGSDVVRQLTEIKIISGVAFDSICHGDRCMPTTPVCTQIDSLLACAIGQDVDNLLRGA